MRILVSAGEASGDRYAAGLVTELRKRLPRAQFFGCGGPQMRAAGVETVVRSEELAVVGLFEVVRHIPRIRRLFKDLAAEARTRRPDLAILTDAPDFHLRLAKVLRGMGVPVAYYVAPQVWAWRKWRIRKIRRLVDQLLVIFPFEESYFGDRGVDAVFVGHPLGDLVRPTLDRDAFFQEIGLDPNQPTVALLPGSRLGEALRHFPVLQDAIGRLNVEGVRQFVLPVSTTVDSRSMEREWHGPPVQFVQGRTSDAVAHADIAIVASGTATVEAAVLGTPMVTYYKLSWPTYQVARHLIDVPHYSMVNLLAGRPVIPEFMQQDCTGAKLAEEALRLLRTENARCQMLENLREVRNMLQSDVPAAQRTATAVCERFGLRAA